MDTYEIRTFTECRVDQLDERRLMGYPIVFHSESLDLGGFKEIIDPSAVDRTLNDGADVRALVDHDSAKVLGRTRAGTMTMRKDGRGLQVTIQPDLEISYAKDIMRAVARGDVSGMSFAFRALSDAWNFDTDPPTRTVTDMKISEVSIVCWPAYQSTDVSVARRSMQEAQGKGSNRLAWMQRRLRIAK